VLFWTKGADLLPDYFSSCAAGGFAGFIPNISRELLQHDRQLKVIAPTLKRTIKKRADRMLLETRDYEKLWKAFGLH
jgi:molecular chaperone HtpG